jgi:CBS domain containing-hemolysin-like protein
MFEMTNYLLVFALSVVGIAFFAGFESAFLSMNKVKLRHKAVKKIKGADFLESLYDNRDNFLGYTLAGMTFFFVLALISAVGLAEVSITNPTNSWYKILVVGAGIPLIVVFGELLPRTYGRDKADRAIFFFVRPVMLTYNFLYAPLVIITSGVTRFFMWLLGTDKSGLGLQSTKEELRLLVRLGEKEGIVEDDERKLIESIFTFHGKHVSTCACGREQIQAVSTSASLSDVAKLIANTGFSRIPVYEHDLDHPVGVVHLSSILVRVNDLDSSVKTVMTPVLKVLPDMTLKKVLESFQKERSHMALIVDGNGKTSGLVTLEDVLEEVVGEITDEFDKKASRS